MTYQNDSLLIVVVTVINDYTYKRVLLSDHDMVWAILGWALYTVMVAGLLYTIIGVHMPVH